jgi:hypothetical protein
VAHGVSEKRWDAELKPSAYIRRVERLRVVKEVGRSCSAPYRALFAVKELPALPKVDVSLRYTLSELGVYVPQIGDSC